MYSARATPRAHPAQLTVQVASRTKESSSSRESPALPSASPRLTQASKSLARPDAPERLFVPEVSSSKSVSNP